MELYILNENKRNDSLKMNYIKRNCVEEITGINVLERGAVILMAVNRFVLNEKNERLT